MIKYLKTWFPALLLLLTTQGQAQQVVFNKIFKNNTSESGFSIIETDSFYYLQTGQAYYDSLWKYWQPICVYKTDKQLNILDSNSWYTTLPDSSFSVAYPYTRWFMQTKDSGFILCGEIKKDSANVKGFILKMDSDLNTVWLKEYADPDSISPGQTGPWLYLVFNGIAQTPDHGYILIGFYRAGATLGDIDGVLLKTDSLGNKEWLKTFKSIGGKSKPFDIAVTPDSGYVIVAGQLEGIYGGHYKLMKTDAQGNPQWSDDLLQPFKGVTIAALDICQDTDVVVAAQQFYVQTSDTWLFNLLAAKYSLAGQKKWEKSYFINKNFRNHGPEWGISVTALPDGSMVAVSGSLVDDTIPPISRVSYWGGVIKLAPNGDSLWCRYYGAQSDTFWADHQVWDIKPTRDGGFIFTGDYWWSGVGVYAWVVKTDSMGLCPGAYTVGLKPQPLVAVMPVKIFPNPASGRFTIAWEPVQRAKDLTVVITDINGRVLHSQQCNPQSTSAEVNTAGLSPGIYLVTLRASQTIIAAKKLVVR